MRKINTFIGALLLSTVVLIAQPGNDVCSGATTLPLDGTCITGETTTGAGDHWIGSVACQPGGGGNEVWYEFTPTQGQVDIDVTLGTMTGDINLILVEATGACAGLSVNGSYCGPASGTLTSTNLSPGVQYYLTINTEGGEGTFDICATESYVPPLPGKDCPSAAPLCDLSPFTQGVFTGIGAVEELSDVSCFGRDERQAKWYSFTVDETGSLEMMLSGIPLDTDDFDWLLINSTTGCYSSGNIINAPIACNWSGETCAETGMSNDPAGTWGVSFAGACGMGASAWEPAPTVTAGETYTLLLDNFSATAGGFDVDFGGTVDAGPDAGFSASLDATCLIATFDRLTNYTGANMSYFWTFGDGTTSTAAVPTHTYSSTGLYTVTLTVTDAIGCSETFSITLDVGCLLLPINAINVKARRKSNTQNEITWAINDYESNSYFEVQKASIIKNNFKTIATIPVYENKRNYSFIDGNVSIGKTFYRIKSFNKNNTSRNSNIVSVNGNDEIAFGVYPNPVYDNHLNVKSNYNEETVTKVYSITGTEMNSYKNSSNSLSQVDISNLNNGVYFVRIISKNGEILHSQKIIVN